MSDDLWNVPEPWSGAVISLVNDMQLAPEQAREVVFWVYGALTAAGLAVVGSDPSPQQLEAGRIACFRVLFPQGTPFDEADCQAAAHAVWKAMLATARPSVEGRQGHGEGEG